MKKQFIAGAVCPDCQQVDKIYVTTEQAEDSNALVDVAICNACGYRSIRPEENEPHAADGEANPQEDTSADAVSVVRIMHGPEHK